MLLIIGSVVLSYLTTSVKFTKKSQYALDFTCIHYHPCQNLFRFGNYVAFTNEMLFLLAY